jgi:hypothetical protein
MSPDSPDTRDPRRDLPRGGDATALDVANRAALAAARRHKIEQQLDEALAATFPASDPVSIVTSQREEDWEDL